MLTDILYDVMLDLVYSAVIIAVVSYFCGCFNGAVIVSKYILHDDIRTHGSGNAGLTNFYRTFGGPLTLVVISCDVLKAIVSILFSVWLISYLGYGGSGSLDLVYARYWAGLWCLLGHIFPCMFGFKGGKGILSGGTIALMLDWRLALLAWGGFFLFAVLTRYVSLGSVFAAAAFPVGTWLFVSNEPVIMVLATGMGLLVVWMHGPNNTGLHTGTYNKFSLKINKE